MVSFSASKTLAALLLCFPLVALESRTCTIIWGQRLTEARSPGQQPQTDPQEESGPGGETFREPNGFLSPGMRVKASICSKKLVLFPADKETSCPSRADPTHFAHPASLGAKNKSVCTEKHSNTSPQHTPSRVPEGKRPKSFRS